MKRFYSLTTQTTYLEGIHTTMPDDAKEISEDLYLEVLANPAAGMVRSHDAEGLPVLIDPPKADQLQALRQQIADQRYEREIAGITWSTFFIATDRESQTKVAQEAAAIGSGLREDPAGWKCLDISSGLVVFRPTTNAEMQEISAALYRYVSACFSREGQLLEAVANGTFTAEMLSQGWPQ